MIHTLENLAHLVGLPILVFLYVLRILALLGHRLVKDRAVPRGKELPGILWAYVTIFMPWSMESTSRQWPRYLEFAFFHLGIFVNILVSFLISYTPRVLETFVREVFVLIVAAGMVMACVRLIRRIVIPRMRIISTPDDYVSLIIAILFLAFGIPAVYGSGMALIIYFLIAFIFLVYEPFSKIRHYIYFPFTRYFYGVQIGSRDLVRKTRGTS
jgi:hypothetical protein